MTNKRLVKKKHVVKSPMHYSRTMTANNLSKAANTVGELVLTGLGKAGQAFNGLLTAGASTDFGQTSPFVMSSAKERRAIQRGRLIVLKKANEKIAQGMTWVSPLNYGAAIWNGHGLNARKGEEEVASWSPAWLATARLIELGVGPKVVKGVKTTPRVVVNTAAKAGIKPARAAVIVRGIKLGIKLNTKNGRIEVTEDYFNAPDKWYRVTERPEKIGIELNGKNVTTYDDPGIHGTANGWRESMLSLAGKVIPGKGIDEGYFIFLPRKRNFSKYGAAHGNTSQAAKGLIWLGTFAFSGTFPRGVIEGLAPVKIFRGMNKLGKDSRTNFVLLNWEDVPLGARVGFHTGEMPMSNLGWFLKTKNGTYTYEPIIPEKRINFTPTKLLEPSKTSSTIQISPEELYKVLKNQELNGYYFMGHGTGRSNVNPQIIFDNGLRIKNGDIGNTTSPISLSSLSLWPHANSKEVIILPGRAENVKFDSARGRIPSDWYDSKTFQWNDNPGFEGSGLFAVLKPNATFVETEINGVPGVYTKPEAILGSYNIDTHTLKLNPKSLYEFLFNVPKLAEPRTSLAFFERNHPFKGKQLTEHVQGDEAVKMFKEYGGEPIPEGSINGELLRKYVVEARERYGLSDNKNITDEEIALALYKHSKELGGNTAAVNAQGEPLLLFRGDTKAYTELRNNHHESGGAEDNILGTLFLDRTGIGEGWGPDRYLYLTNKNGEVMAPYRSGIELENFSSLKPKFKDDYLYDLSGKGFVWDEQISYPYWNYTTKYGETIQGNKIASDNFADGIVNHLNAFVVRTPSVRDITNEVVVIGGKPGTPPPFHWLIPEENRIGPKHDVRLALNKAVVEEAKKHNQGLLKSDRGSYWRGEEHENYDYFALPDFNVRGAKHLLPYDLRIPRNWKDKNIYRGLIPLAGGYTLYNLFNQPLQ